jgi:endonuclease/exonuclease/phosphatase family metal-dependent hydrolase
MLRLMTWNIHGFLGLDGTSNPARTTSVVKRLDPDIVALQEVESRDRGHGAFDGFANFRALGYHDIVEAITVSDSVGHYGHILASHWPITAEQTHDLSVPGLEPRRLIDAYIDLQGHPLRIITSHFGIRERERRKQIAILQDILAQDDDTPVVVMGDFNGWRRRGRLQRILGPAFGSTGAPATFPARFPFLPLDRIWSRPPGLVRRVWAEAEAREASDHLPLLTDLHWPHEDSRDFLRPGDFPSARKSLTSYLP